MSLSQDEEEGTSQGSPLRSIIVSSMESVDSSEEHGFVASVRQLTGSFKGLARGTIPSSIFTLLTTSIGAGTLSLPFAFSRGGLVLSSGIFFSIMLISIIVGFQLFSAKRYCAELWPRAEIWGYEDLAQSAFGAAGKVAVLITLIVFLFLSLIAYMIFARDQLDLIVQFALSHTGHVPDCSPLVNCALLMTIAFVPLFPVNLLRDLTPMQFTSTCSILCISYVALAMLIRMSLSWANYDLTSIGTETSNSSSSLIPEHHKVDVLPPTFKGILTTISYCSLAFVCHFNILPLQKELQRPTKTRLKIIVISSLIIAYLIYNVVIFSGYFTFFGTLKEDVMLNYDRDDILITSARIALFFALLFSYPVLLHPTRASINRLIGFIHDVIVEHMTRTQWGRGRGQMVEEEEEEEEEEDDKRTEEDEKKALLPSRTEVSTKKKKIPWRKWFYKNLMWFCETLIIFGGTFLPASYIPNVGYVWNFVGSIGGTLILYIYPSAFYLRLRYLRYVHRARIRGISVCAQYDFYAVCKEIIAWVIMVLGMLLLIVENYQAIDAVVTASHEPSSLCFQEKCGVDINTSIPMF